jgi:transcription elongation factor GreA
MLMVRSRPVVQAESMRSPQSVQRAGAIAETVVRKRHPGAGAQLLLSAVEYVAYEQELERLRELRSRQLPERLREARSFVAADAAEEIAQIQEEQTVMDARIARLEDLLRKATVMPDGDATDLVTLGSRVEVEYQRTGRLATYRLTGAATRSDGAAVSARWPVGRSLMGRRVGEVVSAELPDGRVEPLRIVAISAALAEAS